MIRIALAAALLFCAAPSSSVPDPTPPARTAPIVVDDKVLHALDAWLHAYRAGEIDFTKTESILKKSIAAKANALPAGFTGELTYARELDLLLEGAAKLDTPEAAALLVECAGVGLDPGKYTRQMAPQAVRALAEKWVRKLTSAAAKDQLAKAARGEQRAADKAQGLATKAAALRCLGLRKDPDARTLLEAQLAAPEPMVRLAAAEGLGNLGDEAAGEALAKAIERETTDTVLEGLVAAVHGSYLRHLQPPAAKAEEKAGKGEDKGGEKSGEKAADKSGDKAGDKAAAARPALPASAALVVQAAVKALGRTSWRADLALVQLLGELRTADVIPALIDILQRGKEHPEDLQSGKLSGLLLHRAHETLVSMTGAVFPLDRPDQWRALWEKEKTAIAIQPERAPKALQEGDTTTGFCGIPVHGTKVVFVLDLSGSMREPMRMNLTTAGAIPDKLPTRLDFAKKALLRAVDDLLPQASFNLVTFNGNPKPEVWNKDLVPATPANRDRFKKHVEGLRADGGTNLWCGLEEALKIKSWVHGDRYASNVDELFLLSDGAPTVGDVRDPIEILHLVHETDRFSKVRVNAVFISSPPGAGEPPMPWMTITPEELMRRLAEENGGHYVQLR